VEGVSSRPETCELGGQQSAHMVVERGSHDLSSLNLCLFHGDTNTSMRHSLTFREGAHNSANTEIAGVIQ
jgi:hypothetical protein